MRQLFWHQKYMRQEKLAMKEENGKMIIEHEFTWKDRIRCWALVLSFFMFMLFIILINAKFPVIRISGREFDAPSLSGVFTVLMIMICLQIMNINKIHGFAIAMALCIIELLSVTYAFIAKGNMGSLAGIAMMLGGTGLLIMQHNHISQIERNRERMRQLSVTDPLTGLMNRRGIIDVINQNISKNIPFTLLYLDLDNFKNINDSMGHAYGDRILCEAAKRWLSVLGEGCSLGRTGGDEFVVVLCNRTQNEVLEIAQNCLNSLEERIVVGEVIYYASASIGAARFPEDGTDSDSLLRYADTAMYKAKSGGKNQLCLFDHFMFMEIKADMDLETEMRNALQNDGFYLVFQPQFSAGTKVLRGYETLLRMKSRSGEPVSPATFIPIAEKSGLILDIDRWVLRNAVETFVKKITDDTLVLSVNISAKHITALDFADDVAQILKETGFPPARLEIEVTESCFISSVDTAIASLSKLKALGIQIALDDFGTGYASLSYLSRLPIDLVKIDKSFIDKLNDEDNRGDFVKAIISIGHMFNCHVIAEGVELDSQLDTLRGLGCDYIQGYLWGKPQRLEEHLLSN